MTNRRSHPRWWLRAAPALTTAALLAVTGTRAQAAPVSLPEHLTVTDTSEFDDTEYCAAQGVPSFHVVQTITNTVVTTYDTSGNFAKAIVHHAQQDVFTANGKTLTESDHWTDTFYPDGSSATVGNHTHVLGEAGLVLRDAGRILQDATGAVVFIAGPHPQFLGDTFCQSLLP